jgi:hypothetical protein
MDLGVEGKVIIGGGAAIGGAKSAGTNGGLRPDAGPAGTRASLDQNSLHRHTLGNLLPESLKTAMAGRGQTSARLRPALRRSGLAGADAGKDGGARPRSGCA